MVSAIINGRTVTLEDSERQPVECWVRVMGYMRPLDNFNIGKKSEFRERKWYTEEQAMKHIKKPERS